MQAIKYKAVNRLGRSICGVVYSKDLQSAEDYLVSINVRPVKCRLFEESGLRVSWVGRARQQRQTLLIFSTDLANLLSSGLATDTALIEIEQSATDASLQRLAASVLAAINKGSSLSESLSDHDYIFDAGYLYVVAAGEKMGELPQSLRRLSESLSWRNSYRAKLRSAIAYPAFTGFVLLSVLIFLITTVVPSLAEFIADAGGELPWHTSLLLACGTLLRESGVFIIMIIGCAMLLGMYVRARNAWVSDLTSRALLRLPVVGGLLREIEIARYTHTLELLVRSRLDILESVQVACTVISNRFLRDSVAMTRTQLSEGVKLSDAMRSCGVFANTSIRLIAVGELSGELPVALARVSAECSESSVRALDRFEKSLGPAMMCMVGLVVIWIVVSVMGPIYTAAVLAGTAL